MATPRANKFVSRNRQYLRARYSEADRRRGLAAFLFIFGCIATMVTWKVVEYFI